MEQKTQSSSSGSEEDARYSDSGIPLKDVYTPEDLKDVHYDRDLANPGSYPYTRGLYAAGYRNFAWGQRPVLGYGTPEETGERIRYLLKYGMQSPGGLPSYNLTMDMTSAYGYDSDDPRFAQWVGVSGPPCNSIQDVEAIIEGMPLEGMYHGVLCYAPCWRVAHLIAIADNQNVPLANIAGATLNDSLHSPIGEGCHLFPPRGCLRLIVDTLKFVTERMPRFRACDVQAYSSREAGCNAAQEVGFAIGDMIEVVTAALALGLDVDELASHLTFFFAVSSDFFEEVAKFRAARKVWAQIMRERFGAKQDRSCRMRIQGKTSASTLPAQHPQLNIARTGFQAMSAVFGGVGGLNITAMDEAFGAPTEYTARTALLIGKVLEHETGIINVADPLAGSYYVEALTRDMEQAVWEIIEKLDSMGGYIAGLENGYIQNEIARVNTEYSVNLDTGRQVMVGVNKFAPEEGEEEPIDVFEQDPMRTYRIMSERLATLRKERDNGLVQEILAELREAVQGDGHLMPIYVKASKAHCTTSEIYGLLKEVLGEDDNVLIPPGWKGQR